MSTCKPESERIARLPFLPRWVGCASPIGSAPGSSRSGAGGAHSFRPRHFHHVGQTSDDARGRSGGVIDLAGPLTEFRPPSVCSYVRKPRILKDEMREVPMIHFSHRDGYHPHLC